MQQMITWREWLGVMGVCMVLYYAALFAYFQKTKRKTTKPSADTSALSEK